MSAFVVENRTINTILAGVRHAAAAPYIAYPHLGLNGHGAGISWDRDSLIALGARLRALNVAAVKARYSDSTDDDLPDYTFRPVAPPSGPALLKALRCLLYQCSEGRVPDRAIFKALDEWSDQIATHIICQMPEYQAAPWD